MSRSFPLPLPLSLCSCFQSMIHFEIPLKRSLFDIKRVWREWEKEWVKKKLQSKKESYSSHQLIVHPIFSTAVSMFLSLSPMISICIEILLFDVWGLLSLFFFSPLCICLFKTMTFFFHFQNVYRCIYMFDHQATAKANMYHGSSNTLFAYSSNEWYVNFRRISRDVELVVLTIDFLLSTDKREIFPGEQKVSRKSDLRRCLLLVKVDVARIVCIGLVTK